MFAVVLYLILKDNTENEMQEIYHLGGIK